MHRRQTLDTWQCMYVTIGGKMCTNKCNFAFQVELLTLWMQRPQTPFQGSGARLIKTRHTDLGELWGDSFLTFPDYFFRLWGCFLKHSCHDITQKHTQLFTKLQNLMPWCNVPFYVIHDICRVKIIVDPTNETTPPRDRRPLSHRPAQTI